MPAFRPQGATKRPRTAEKKSVISGRATVTKPVDDVQEIAIAW
jgi:hypothetical protein